MRLLLLFCFLINTVTYSKTFHFSSGKNQVQLLELYTSESCSSCPPAERKLNSFKTSSKLWKEIVPVEFHVDYWNYLHWNDRFSKPEFSQRQRWYHSKIKAGVYTPQMILNGKDLRGWRSHLFRKNYYTPGILNADLDSKNLKVKLSFQQDKTLNKKDLYCHMAIMGGGFTSKVKSGENSGRTLSHQFVVLEFYKSKISKAQTCEYHFNKKKIESFKAKSYSFAAWVAEPNGARVIQATGGNI